MDTAIVIFWKALTIRTVLRATPKTSLAGSRSATR